MRKTYGIGSLIILMIVFAFAFWVGAASIPRAYRHVQAVHMHGRELRGGTIFLYAIIAIAFLYLAYYLVRIFLRLNMVTTADGSIIVRPLNFFKPSITFRTSDLSRVHFLANKRKPELTIVTPGNELNLGILGNYLELVNLHDALAAMGVPVYISGPSAHYFKMDKKKLRKMLIIFYIIITLVLIFYFVRFLLIVSRHHH